MENIQEMINQHTHPPSQVKCEVTKLKSNINRRSTDTLDPARQILGAEVRNILEAVAVNMPLNESMRRNIRPQRQIRHEHHNPIAIEAIPELPQEFQVTSTAEQFMLYDIGVGDQNRKILFAGPNAVELLKQSWH